MAPRSSRGELVRGDEAVAVPGVVPELEHGRRLYALRAVRRSAELEGEMIRLREAAAYMRSGDYVWVGAERVHGRVGVEAVEPHGEYGAQSVGAEELHEPAEPGLAPEVARYLLRLEGAYAAYLREPLRRALEHVEGLVSESVHYQRGRRGAYALDRAVREVAVYGLLRAREAPLGVLGLELPAVARMVCPLSEHVQLLAGVGGGYRTHDDAHAAVRGLHAQHRPAVFLVCIYDGDYPSVHFLEFRFLQLIPFPNQFYAPRAFEGLRDRERLGVHAEVEQLYLTGQHSVGAEPEQRRERRLERIRRARNLDADAYIHILPHAHRREQQTLQPPHEQQHERGEGRRAQHSPEHKSHPHAPC